MQRGILGRLLASGARAFVLVAVAAPAAHALTPNLRIESNLLGALLGDSMANAGDVNGDGIDDLIVGALDWNESDVGLEYGAVFLFLGGGEALATGDLSQADTRIVSEQSGARLGTAVGSAGDVNGDGYGDIIVGAGGWDGGQDNEGAAFIYLGGPDGIPDGNLASADTTLQGDWQNARLGTSSGHADVNGDGYDDVIVGGRLYQSDGATTQEGYALIFLGSENGVASGGRATAHAQIESDQAGATMGEAVAGVGDVNDDGYEDVLIGAPRWSHPDVREGAAFLYLGSATGIPSGNPSTADAVLEGQQTDGRFGRELIGLGDVNADGYDDVAISATQYDRGQSDEGAVFVYLGSAGGLVGAGPAELGPGDAVAVFESDQTDVHATDREYFGYALGTGDWDGDGFTDLLVSSPYYDGTLDAEGAAFLFRGDASGFTSTHAADADRIFLSGVRNAWMGASVALVDLDDDGRDDVWVGGNRMSYPIPAESSEGMILGFPRIAACENTADDDGDGDADLADGGCATAGDAYEEIDFANGFPTNVVSDARDDTVVARDSTTGAPTTVALAAGGSTTGDFVAIEHSIARVTGGSVAGDLVAADAASAEIESGSVAGGVVALGGASIVIRGGIVVALEARDTATIELHGLSFALPDGEVAELTGTIEGTLADGTPIAASFARDAGATIRLVPEPGAAAIALAAIGSLAVLRRRGGVA